jgi:hypothetical protein
MLAKTSGCFHTYTATFLFSDIIIKFILKILRNLCIIRYSFGYNANVEFHNLDLIALLRVVLRRITERLETKHTNNRAT